MLNQLPEYLKETRLRLRGKPSKSVGCAMAALDYAVWKMKKAEDLKNLKKQCP